MSTHGHTSLPMSVMYGSHSVSVKVCITQGTTLCLDPPIDTLNIVYKTLEEKVMFFLLQL